MSTYVAVLTPGFAVDEADTNCVPALQDLLLSSRTRAPGVRHTVFSLRYPHRRQRYSWHGIEVFPSGGREALFPAIVPSWARPVAGFARAARRSPVDLIHSFWLGECAMLGELLSRCWRVPHVVTLMGQDVVGRNRYTRLLRSRRTVFVAVSEYQRRQLLKHSGCDVRHVIPWGLPELEDAEAGTRDIDILGAGSLTDVKDFETFVHVVSLVRTSRPMLVCRIAGDGPNRARLEAKARSLGLADAVRFEGRLPREEVLALMRRSRVLLHTSRFESFGLVFAEALACGARIVSRDVGIAERGPAWFVGDDPQEMAAAILRFLDEPNAPKPVVHSIERAVLAYSNLYRTLCAREPSAVTAE